MNLPATTREEENSTSESMTSFQSPKHVLLYEFSQDVKHSFSLMNTIDGLTFPSPESLKDKWEKDNKKATSRSCF
ncbi:unnamed protein product [Urochloa humidicola]